MKESIVKNARKKSIRSFYDYLKENYSTPEEINKNNSINSLVISKGRKIL
jgi:hypothetical protein